MIYNINHTTINVYYWGIYNHKAGLENFSKNLITAVTKLNKNYHYKIISCFSSIPYEDYFKSLGCEIFTLPYWKTHHLKFYYDLRNILSKANNSIIHLNVCSYLNFPLFYSCKKSK